MNYESQIRNYIVPNLGDVPLLLFVRDAPERLESFYARLRRCRELCSGRPFVEQHEAAARHDCTQAGCRSTTASHTRPRASARSTRSSAER